MKNMKRITPWWDRRVMGGLLVAVVPVSMLVAFAQPRPEVSLSGSLLLAALMCVLIWAARLQIVPSVSVSATTLVIHNVYSRYQIPWRMVSGVDWEPQGELYLNVANGLRVRVEAFSRWPSFGRHRKVIENLEEGRRLAAGGSEIGAGPAAEEVRVTETSGITEFVLALAIGLLLLAIVVKGVIALVN